MNFLAKFISFCLPFTGGTTDGEARIETEKRYRDVTGILQIVKDGLCHRCGACVGVCPVGTLAMDEEGHPYQKADCINCNLCVKSCSGVSVDYPAIGEQIFGPEYQYGALIGSVLHSCVAHASDDHIRRLGASGGCVTQLLIHLLETGQIKGALVAIQDPEDPARGKGIIARTRSELIQAAQSRYTTTPSFAALEEIQKDPGPYAAVGLPCQIHALRKRQLLNARWKTRVPITIGLHCSGNPPALSTRELARVMGPRDATLTNIEYRSNGTGEQPRGWPMNSIKMTFSNGEDWVTPFGHPQTYNILARLAPLGRCMTCVDHSAEFADLAIGDPWIRDGVGGWKHHDTRGSSVILARTAMGEKILADAVHAGALVVEDVTNEDIINGQRHVLNAKKTRVGMRISARKAMGLRVPYYPMHLPRPQFRAMKDEAFNRIVRTITSIKPLRTLALRMAFTKFGSKILDRRAEHRRKDFVSGRLG